jgi:hypothetical protein
MGSVSEDMVGLPKGIEVYEKGRVYRGNAPGRLRPEKNPQKKAGGSKASSDK